MHSVIVESHGHDKSLFSKFDTVMSGHFHKKSDDGQIFYLGSQYELTWSDYNDPKHFHIWDTDTGELTPIRNPLTIHDKLYYNDRDTNYDEYDITPHIDKHLKLIVVNKTNPEMLDRLLDRFYKVNMHELKIIEDYSDLDAGNVSDDIVDRSIEEFEYHVNMARWMGYGKEFQDFKINVHISGRKGPQGIIDVMRRLTPEARNVLTIENDEMKWQLEHSLELEKTCALVLDIHHPWVATGEYLSLIHI